MTTPLFFATARSMSSVMFLGALVRARAEECDAMTGALLIAIASQNVLSATWDMSTIMPRRFISRTTCLPKSNRLGMMDLGIVDVAGGISPVVRVGPAQGHVA